VSEDFNVIITDTNGSATVSESQTTVTATTGTSVVQPSTYVHIQSSASSTWTISHSLGRKPSVTIVDSGGNVQIGEVLYDSDNQITLAFAAAFSGYAYLN
jgi:hypothetical protein